MTDRSYSREEVKAIFTRALHLPADAPHLSHEDLVAAAREAGLGRDAVEHAAEQVLAERRDAAEFAELRARDRRGFWAHLVPYLAVNAALVGLNLLSGGPWWSLFVVFGWGIGLVSHLVRVAFPDPVRMRRRVERNRARARRRAAAARIGGLIEDRVVSFLEQNRAPARTGRFRVSQPPQPATHEQELEVEHRGQRQRR